MTSSAAVGGLLVVAAIFFLGNLHNYHESISWMKREKDWKWPYLSLWTFTVAWFFLPFATLLAYAFDLSLRGIRLIADVPGGNQVLDAAVTGEVSSLLDAFDSYLGYAILFIPMWILVLLFFPVASDYYLSFKKAVDVSRSSPRMADFTNRIAFNYLADKPSERPTDGDVLKWASVEWDKGENSSFYVYLQTQISELFNREIQELRAIRNWTAAILVTLFIVFVLVITLID